jgi:phosphoribosyl-ATP pyrophosphohydrolase
MAKDPPAHIIDRLYAVIQSRKDADPGDSNTARLFDRGVEKIAQKLGEEAVETVIEAINGKRKAVVAESADLLYHLLVLWAARGIDIEDVWTELGNREGISGIAEKATRKKAAAEEG